jgi:hypothetical protein
MQPAVPTCMAVHTSGGKTRCRYTDVIQTPVAIATRINRRVTGPPSGTATVVALAANNYLRHRGPAPGGGAQPKWKLPRFFVFFFPHKLARDALRNIHLAAICRFCLTNKSLRGIRILFRKFIYPRMGARGSVESHYATSRKVAGTIPNEVVGFFQLT